MCACNELPQLRFYIVVLPSSRLVFVIALTSVIQEGGVRKACSKHVIIYLLELHVANAKLKQYNLSGDFLLFLKT